MRYVCQRVQSRSALEYRDLVRRERLCSSRFCKEGMFRLLIAHVLPGG